MDIRSTYARAVADLEKTEARLQEVQARVNELRAIRDGLKLALERYEKPLEDQGAAVEHLSVERAQADGTAPRRSTSRTPAKRKRRAKGKTVRQTDLALAALKELGEPASTHAVLNSVNATGATGPTGQPFTYDQIRGALTWLLRQDKVERPAPATWALPTEEAPSQDDFTPAAGAAGVSKAGENGHSTQDGVLIGADLSPQPAG